MFLLFKWFLESIKNKACEILKIKEFTLVNDCFQDEYNAVIDALLRDTFYKVASPGTQSQPVFSGFCVASKALKTSATFLPVASLFAFTH